MNFYCSQPYNITTIYLTHWHIRARSHGRWIELNFNASTHDFGWEINLLRRTREKSMRNRKNDEEKNSNTTTTANIEKRARNEVKAKKAPLYTLCVLVCVCVQRDDIYRINRILYRSSHHYNTEHTGVCRTTKKYHRSTKNMHWIHTSLKVSIWCTYISGIHRIQKSHQKAHVDVDVAVFSL